MEIYKWARGHGHFQYNAVQVVRLHLLVYVYVPVHVPVYVPVHVVRVHAHFQRCVHLREMKLTRPMRRGSFFVFSDCCHYSSSEHLCLY